MNVNRAFTPQEKKAVIIIMIVIIVVVGLTRPMWSKQTSDDSASVSTTVSISETVESGVSE